ncbi:MAG: glycosyltransferase [Treponema sp.]|nr:glycosyltransferase [Treponema sp.]
MRLLLVTRGSQGDVYPYLRLAVELKNRGHDVTLSLPRLFEKLAGDHGLEGAGIRLVLQASDDIAGMLQDTPDTKNLLDWTRRVIGSQFREIIPLLREHDLLVSSNTEFAAGSIAEYCGKPFVRTAYGPFIPTPKFPPPVFPWPKAHPVFRPRFLWWLLNGGLNMMVKKPLNQYRRNLGLPPIKDQSKHAPENAFNFLMYSKFLGSVDENWKYRWDIGGYCFNDILPYDKAELERLSAFAEGDSRPTVFFSLGSCNTKHGNRFAEMLFDVCVKHGFKLIVACGWWDVGAKLEARDNLFRLESIVPHNLVFARCDAVIHHGGAGTTHSAARSRKPQMVVPLLLDQFYWNHRVGELGLGPRGVRIKSVTKTQLEGKLVDLVNNPCYKEKAGSMADLIRGENGIDKICLHIESWRDLAKEGVGYWNHR